CLEQVLYGKGVPPAPAVPDAPQAESAENPLVLGEAESRGAECRLARAYAGLEHFHPWWIHSRAAHSVRPLPRVREGAHNKIPACWAPPPPPPPPRGGGGGGRPPPAASRAPPPPPSLFFSSLPPPPPPGGLVASAPPAPF